MKKSREIRFTEFEVEKEISLEDLNKADELIAEFLFRAWLKEGAMSASLPPQEDKPIKGKKL